MGLRKLLRIVGANLLAHFFTFLGENVVEPYRFDAENCCELLTSFSTFSRIKWSNSGGRMGDWLLVAQCLTDSEFTSLIQFSCWGWRGSDLDRCGITLVGFFVALGDDARKGSCSL